MKLSIGMIVKNEEKYLEQCLTAVKPILENVDSELIIADTGSTDRTVEIAKKFTDNVFYFEWINDFAAARNSTIERAKGEWYLYIDADEIFRDCDGIIRFFNSGEYLKYTAASYTIFNKQKNSDSKAHDNFFVTRLTKMYPETRFVGIVHEAINTTHPPIKHLNVVADHYGYAISADEMKKKADRNISLMMMRLEEEKENPILYMQIFESMISSDRSEEAPEYLDKGIECAKAQRSIFLFALYGDKAFYCLYDKNFEKTLEICEEYFKDKAIINNQPIATDAELLAIKGQALYQLDRYEEAVAVLRDYFEVFKDVQSGKLSTVDMYFYTFKFSTDTNFIHVLNVFVKCCLNVGKYNLADTYISSFPIYKYSIIDRNVDGLVFQALEVLEHFDYKNIYKYIERFGYENKDKFISTLLRKLYLTDDKTKVIPAFRELGKKEPIYNEKARLYECYCSESGVSAEQLYSFANKYPVNKHFDLFLIAMEKGYDISPLFDSPDFDMQLCVFDCYHEIVNFPETAENYPIKTISAIGDLEKTAVFFEYCMMCTLNYKTPKPETIKFISANKLMERYSEIGDRYVRENNITDEADLPVCIQTALMVGKVIKLRSEKQYKECISLIRQIIAKNKNVAAVISEYGKSVISEFEEQSKSQQDNLSEMERLAITIKNNIINLMKAGNMDAARKTLNDYASLNPGDPEIETLKNELNKEGSVS